MAGRLVSSLICIMAHKLKFTLKICFVRFAIQYILYFSGKKHPLHSICCWSFEINLAQLLKITDLLSDFHH